VARGLSLVAGGAAPARVRPAKNCALAKAGVQSVPALAGTFGALRASESLPSQGNWSLPAPSFPTLSELFASHPRDGGWTGFLLPQTNTENPILWVQERMAVLESGRIHPPGLPSRNLIHVETRDARDALWAMEEGLRCAALSTVIGDVPIEVCASPEDVMAKAAVISFATTAVQPTIAGVSACRPGATVLHVSLRDLMPEAILQADNVVDDVDHVMRAQTSVHLAQQKVGNHDFVRCTLADILLGTQPARRDATSVAVFSPFGLGVLDLAVAKLAVRHARAKDRGVRIDGFFAGT